MPYNSLRDWLEVAERRGELLKISGAGWNLEMASIAEIINRESKGIRPAILFDDIPGYPKGYRTLFGMPNSVWKIASTLGLPEDLPDKVSLLRSWRNKTKGLHLIPPKFVSTGPVLANSLTGDQIDVLKFPVPKFHELDGGRYIGTGVADIQKDPDNGWVNLGTYRVMVVDHNRLAFHVVEGHHGSLIMQKYFSRGREMPIAIVAGVDHPLLYWASCSKLAGGFSEYAYAGGIKGEPIEVIEGPYTGLPIPANAEIVIEGECHPGELVDEGPFGEWHGYYANLGLKKVPEPVIRVKAIHHRDNPILTCAHMSVPFNDQCLHYAIDRSEGLWGRLEMAGILGIKGVWCHEIGGGDLFNVISLEQLYAGHAQTAGIIASQYQGASVVRYTVVVEEDIDPTDLEQVIWAIVTRVPAEQSIQILERCRGSSADPAIPLAEKMKYRVTPKPLHTAKVIINACRPFEHKAEWYPIARISPELREEIINKWGPVISKFIA